MDRILARLRLALLLSFALRPLQAQEAPQDPGLDNLVHAASYVTAEPGALGAVVERGSGPIDLVLVSGFGLGASAFEGFLERNAERYHMLAVTLPGFEGSAAPPMPPAGTSYGAQTWTNAAVEAVGRLLEERDFERPVLVGHSLNGAQVAARVALAQPELVRALVLLAGSPRFEPLASTTSWPRGLTLEQKVAAVDTTLAPRWFRTVTRKTWVANNFVATDYSIDAARGQAFATRANEPPLPVLVRWLCEFHASDLCAELAELDAPLLVIQPSFTPALRADPARAYLAAFFQEPWRGALAERPRTEMKTIENAGILVMDDQPGEVDRALASFLERQAP